MWLTEPCSSYKKTITHFYGWFSWCFKSFGSLRQCFWSFNNRQVANTGAIQTEANFLSFYFQLASWESASGGVVSFRASGSNGLTPRGSYSSFKSHKQDIHLNWNRILYMVHSFKSPSNTEPCYCQCTMSICKAQNTWMQPERIKGSDINLAERILGRFVSTCLSVSNHDSGNEATWVKNNAAGVVRTECRRFKRHTKRHLESVDIQHKETEQCFWTGLLQKAFQSDK